MASKQELEQFLQLIKESDNKQKCSVKYTYELSNWGCEQMQNSYIK